MLDLQAALSSFVYVKHLFCAKADLFQIGWVQGTQALLIGNTV